jgi:hypothetical protein
MAGLSSPISLRGARSRSRYGARSPSGPTEYNILNSVLHDIIASTGSPFAQSAAIEEGWDEYTRTVSAHENDNRGSDLSATTGKTSSGLSGWEKYYGEPSSQYATIRVHSPPPARTEAASRQSKREEGAEDYPHGLQLALIISVSAYPSESSP